MALKQRQPSELSGLHICTGLSVLSLLFVLPFSLLLQWPAYYSHRIYISSAHSIYNNITTVPGILGHLSSIKVNLNKKFHSHHNHQALSQILGLTVRRAKNADAHLIMRTAKQLQTCS